MGRAHTAAALLAGTAVLYFRTPAWLAFVAGAAVALVFDRAAPLDEWRTRATQLGLMLIGAGVPLADAGHAAASSAVLVIAALAFAGAEGQTLALFTFAAAMHDDERRPVAATAVLLAAITTRRPWFLLGFVALSAFYGLRFDPARELIVWSGKRLLVLALFFAGLSLTRRAPLRWLILAAAAFILAQC